MTSGIIRNHAVLFGPLSFPFHFFCLTIFFLPLQPPSAPSSPRPSAPSSRSAARRIPSTARSPVAPRAPSSAFTVRPLFFSLFFSLFLLQPFPMLMPNFLFRLCSWAAVGCCGWMRGDGGHVGVCGYRRRPLWPARHVGQRGGGRPRGALRRILAGAGHRARPCFTAEKHSETKENNSFLIMFTPFLFHSIRFLMDNNKLFMLIGCFLLKWHGQYQYGYWALKGIPNMP